MLPVNYWLLRKIGYDLLLFRLTVTPSYQQAGYDHSNEVRDQVPTGVDVAADVCLRQRQRDSKLDHFVETTKAHRGGSTQRQHAQSRNRHGWITHGLLCRQDRTQAFPADQRGYTETECVDYVVVLQQVRDQPEAIKHSMLAIDRPGITYRDETTGHVDQSPAAESPEYQRAEPDTAIGKPDDTPENQHDHDVEDEL